MQSDKKICLKLEDNLLPLIPDDITVNNITSKLSWRDFYVLSRVNHAWCHVVRSRQVYNESFQSHSTETSFLGYYTTNTIALYSTRECAWYKVPPILDLGPDVRIPPGSRCVSMDGKIYVLGGRINSETSSQVLVFDVAGGGQWKWCSSMRDRREGFECGVRDGKIYVFGGKTVSTLSSVAYTGRPPMKGSTVTTLVIYSEVYDPKEDAWSPIKPMKSFRCGHVATIGEELFVQIADSLDAYHPVKDEWRVVQTSWRWQERQLFTAQGKFHSIGGVHCRGDWDGGWLFMDESLTIHAYHVRDDSWTHTHSFSFDGLLPVDYVALYPVAILGMEKELVAIVRWKRREDNDGSGKGQCLLQSRGFGSENKEISWELRDFSFGNLPDTARYFVHKL